MEIFTKAKWNCIAYKLPQKRSACKKRAKVSLRNLFSTMKLFLEITFFGSQEVLKLIWFRKKSNFFGYSAQLSFDLFEQSEKIYLRELTKAG